MKTPLTRREDFESRASYSPDSVYTHRQRGWRYIPIHPFSDEPDILKRLNLKPEQCTSADAYWAVDDDVVFFEVISELNLTRESGNYCRTRQSGGNVAIAVLADGGISRAHFEELMIVFYDTGRLLDTFPECLTPI